MAATLLTAFLTKVAKDLATDLAKDIATDLLDSVKAGIKEEVDAKNRPCIKTA